MGTTLGPSFWIPSLLPRVHDDPWSYRPEEDEETILALEENNWDKKISALKQVNSKGQPMGNVLIEQVEEDPEMEESVSEEFAEANTSTP
ncbi:hypothetical protein GUITHDRAFT_109094 [Guillardia theta CCMP2712]|uniref:Uncharacterized protein n=2 Tax=Guillardia theta TaxID=55529 RepID=L1J946_GUITC|nr:hypothetical protein GUITHDRAFT_109094 [Guillardia theta CCMP2712]EKX45051.1 hypothetical protein GUITHDRAFT_109094 [Guillardia theta CCMP2712]|eukprot:XP_005832031.1 hypothetical protein GUITHDRAFT_109094 [Guillardia theta CCMP2712]